MSASIGISLVGPCSVFCVHSPFGQCTEAMATDDQAKLLFELVYRQDTQVITAAVKAGISEATARKYLRHDKLPRES